MPETPSLPRTFVSFSSADKGRYDLMCAWKAHEHIDFNFADFQLDEAINSQRPSYIKSACAAKIRRVDTFVLLIGNDTRTKTVFVKDEVETAVEKGCRLIGVNLNNCRFIDALCPAFFADVGALFVPFSPRIIAEALTWQKQGAFPWYHFLDKAYTQLGYQLIGNTAVLPPPPNPFGGGNRPPWARLELLIGPRECLTSASRRTGQIAARLSRPFKRGVKATRLRTAIWRCDLGAELPHLADGSPRPVAVFEESGERMTGYATNQF